MERFISFFGMLALLGVTWLLSKNRKAISYKVVIGGTILEIIFAVLIMRVPWGQQFFMWINGGIVKLLSFTDEGAKFVFGGLVNNQSLGFIFAFQVLPTIIFFSSLMSVLYYLGIMQKIVMFFARIMVKILDTSGAESLVASANIFVGQTEAPLAIRPYFASLTESELFVVMVAGMGTIAGGVMAAYAGMLMPYIPGIGGQLLASCIMSAIGSIVIAKMLIPETEVPKTHGKLKMQLELTDKNVIDAAANSTETVTLAANPAATGINPVTNRIYVTNGDSVTVLAGAVTSTAIAASTTSIAMNPALNEIYFRTSGTSITTLDGTTGVAKGTIALPTPRVNIGN
ncbi:MAG: Na+ dependent nucleoside transporter N-terminal domain-containing protein, partial [Elusimicrobiota bacterium]